MKTTKEIFSILFIGFLLFSSGCSKDDENEANTHPNPNLRVYTNQTGDPDANALQAHIIDEQNRGIMNIYGTFNADGTPKQISNIRYKRVNNDSVVNLIIDEQTGKPELAIMEVNGQKLNIITEFGYTANNNELIISFYDHNWSDGSSDLLYSAKYTQEGSEISESPIFVAERRSKAGNKISSSSTSGNRLWGAISIGSGIAIAEAVAAAGGGYSLLGPAAATVTAAVAAVGVGTLITVGITVATLASIINDAGASEILPRDIPYPENTEANNPMEEENVPDIPENPCFNSTISLDLGLDPGNEIVAIATGGDGGPYTFYWSTDESTTANTYTSIVVEEEGLYSAFVLDGNGCAASATIEVGEIFGCGGLTEFTDPRDGQTYAVVTIGNQCWFAENLNYEMEDSWCYDDDPANCETYGRLYTWGTARNYACPDGWHVPSDEEWTELTDYLGGADVAGEKMKSGSGFSGLFGGYRVAFFGDDVGYYREGEAGYFWSSSTNNYGYDAWFRQIYRSGPQVSRSRLDSDRGMSCRCIKD